MPSPEPPDLAALRAAHDRIHPHVHRTPVVTSAFFDRLVGGRVFFKCENLQRVGAFKVRGAVNAVLSLSEGEARRGIVTHSSGNHAQAVALAARLRGVPAHVVMPTTAPTVKRAAVEGYGAFVHPCEPTLEAREATAAEVVRATGGAFVHPFDDPRVVAGQGTAALELLEDVPDLDVVLAPVGGGGLLSGTAIAVRGLRPSARVVAAEPEGADDAARSLALGRLVPSVSPRTLCDALLTSLSDLTFGVIRELVERVVTVSDEDAVTAMRRVLERMKLLVEVSSAVPVAALTDPGLELRGLRVGVILSGGNADPDRLPWLRPVVAPPC